MRLFCCLLLSSMLCIFGCSGNQPTPTPEILVIQEGRDFGVVFPGCPTPGRQTTIRLDIDMLGRESVILRGSTEPLAVGDYIDRPLDCGQGERLIRFAIVRYIARGTVGIELIQSEFVD